MLPRRIVALGVCFALLLVLLSASVAGARETLVHNGNNSAGESQPFIRFAMATSSGIVRTTTSYSGLVPALSSELKNYGCVVLHLNESVIDKYRRASLKGYVDGGGTLIAVGEYQAFGGGAANAAMNAVSQGVPAPSLDAGPGIGSTMTLEPTTIDFTHTTTTNIGSPALTGGATTGVTTIGYDATSSISLGAGGIAVARASGGQAFIGIEQIGSNGGRFVLVGDSNTIIDSPDEYTPYDNDVLWSNLCRDQSPPDITITSPVANARYKLGAVAGASYFCTDEDDRPSPFFTDVATCASPNAPPGPYDGGVRNETLDTSIAGNRTFTVNATDLSGNPASKTVGYVVDGTPPVITITTPADGATYNRQSSNPAAFDCVDPDGPTPTITFATTPLGISIDTTTPGQKSFKVTCVDQVGNSSELIYNYTVVDASPPVIAITTPAQSARFRLNQSVTALYSCTDPDGPGDIAFCTGPVAVGGLVPTSAPGPADFTVTSADIAGNPAELTHQYVVDASPPAITITVPANGAKYNKGSQILANYACTDADGPQDVASCNGPVVNGQVVDSSAAGAKTFKVDAADIAGNTATKTVNYTILGTSPPSVAIASPADGATFRQGAPIPLSFSCADPDGPADIKSCARVGGTGVLDSSKPGKFEVTARVEDFAENVRTKTHSYTVLAPDAPGGRTAPGTGNKPATRVCKSRRSFTIRVKKKKGVRIVSATVFVNGKKRPTKKGKRITSRVTLTGLKKGRYTVVIKAKLSDGRTVTDRRRFKTCTPKGK